jgi:hypothetical protein
MNFEKINLLKFINLKASKEGWFSINLLIISAKKKKD